MRLNLKWYMHRFLLRLCSLYSAPEGYRDHFILQLKLEAIDLLRQLNHVPPYCRAP
jgi:hypothetical protein